MSVNTEATPSEVRSINDDLEFMRRLRASGLHDLLVDNFLSTDSPVPFEELVYAARKLVKYRYATVKLENYESVRVFGVAIGYNAPFDTDRMGMLVDLVQKASRGGTQRITNDWTQVKGQVEARILRRDLLDCWGRGAHTITLQVRTPLPAPKK